MFAWYWLADLCAEYQIPFVLGHALYMKAIHGGKTKTDKIDSQKIALLLRGGMLPQAYVYPPAMRATRDLRNRPPQPSLTAAVDCEVREVSNSSQRRWSWLGSLKPGSDKSGGNGCGGSRAAV
jgi:hypothetical protein